MGLKPYRYRLLNQSAVNWRHSRIRPPIEAGSMLMNVVTSACAVCGVSFLFLAIGNVHGQTQSVPAPAPSQDPAKPSAKQPAAQTFSPKELPVGKGHPPPTPPPR